MKWIEKTCFNVKKYQLGGDEPEVIYVIKTGFEDEYMVIYEDAYRIDLGKVEFYTLKQLKEKLNIEP